MVNFEIEILKIIELLFRETVEDIIPCGNHDLNRNYVYQVVTKSNVYIVKFYNKSNKRIRELNALKIIKNNELKILGYGETDLNVEWTVYNYVDGLILDNYFETINMQNRLILFSEIGEKMALIHTSKTFDYFGDWVKSKQSPLDSYKNFIINDSERLIANLDPNELKKYPEISKAIKHLRAEYPNIRKLKYGRLCHRDFDGRNIIISNEDEHYHLKAILDYEKCVVFNEYYDIIGLYRKYFVYYPELIESFFSGYEKLMVVQDDFNTELRFNLYRIGIDLCSWSLNVSQDFFNEAIEYLNQLLIVDSDLKSYEHKKSSYDTLLNPK